MDLRVIRGDPTLEEVAALVAALVPRIRAGAPAEPTRRMSRWRASALPGARRPGPPHPSPGAWRTSGLPL